MNVFLDSNILLYASNPHDPRKQQAARGQRYGSVTVHNPFLADQETHA
jgi:predicted nucleic acid-binding protein